MAKPGATPLARMRELLSVCDVLFEVRDARAPLSSKHPRSQEIFGNLPRVIVLAKKDLADQSQLGSWVKQLSTPECLVLALALKQTKGKESLVKAAVQLSSAKLEVRARKGMLPRPVRACVVGLPNVGKSSLINWLTGRKKAPVADRPGVTRAPQWIRIHPSLELLDTPGILPPVKFSGEQATKLALCNILPQDHFDPLEVASNLLVMDSIVQKLVSQLHWPVDRPLVLEELALSRSLLGPGGVPDVRRAAEILISELRHGKLGGVILDSL